MSQYSYIIIYDNNNESKEIDGDYIIRRYALAFIKQYKCYVFRFKNNLDILYLNYPIKDYYRNDVINDIENPTEESVISYNYLEVRLTPKFPYFRIGTNIGSL